MDTKILRDSAPTLVTHNGMFHADDVLATAMLLILDPYLTVIRTRDPALIKEAKYAVDVGGIYNPEEGRFDHHQRGRAGARQNGIFYSSAGLVWKNHGSAITRQIFAYGELSNATDEAELQAQEIAQRVDENFISAICAGDNGQALFKDSSALFPGVGSYSFARLVSSLNLTWLEGEHADFTEEREEDTYTAFLDAVALADRILCRELEVAYAFIRAKGRIEKAIASSDSDVLVLENFTPWHEHLGSQTSHLICVFRSPEKTWMAQAVPAESGSFKSKVLFPEPWRGLNDAELQALSQVDDAVFCHPGGFIAGARSKQGALDLARKAIAEVLVNQRQ